MAYLSEAGAILGLLLMLLVTLMLLILMLPCEAFWRISDRWQGVRPGDSTAEEENLDEF